MIVALQFDKDVPVLDSETLKRDLKDQLNSRYINVLSKQMIFYVKYLNNCRLISLVSAKHSSKLFGLGNHLPNADYGAAKVLVIISTSLSLEVLHE